MMRLLLDTHILLWAIDQPARLDLATRDLLQDPENEVMFSAASIWEIAIKTGRGRPDFMIRPQTILQAAVRSGFEELPVDARAAACVADLPPYHRDPFDRLLVAQAMEGPLRLLTADPALARYSELVMLIR